MIKSKEPVRILQLYSVEKQRQFKHFSALDRLEWLEAIQELHRAALAHRMVSKTKRR